MTGGPPTPPFHDRPRVRTWQAIADIAQLPLAVLGLLAAIIGIVVAVVLAGSGGSSTQVPSTPAVSSGGPGTPTSTSQDAVVGTCVDGSGGPTGCGNPHAAEVVAVDAECSTVDLLAYLGGTTELDVLGPRVAVRTATVGGAEACVVDFPDGAARTGSVRDVLLGPDDDLWRRCVDDRVDRDVECSSPHTSEVVSLVGADAAACLSRADEYAGTTLSRFDFDLVVGAADDGTGHQRCTIAVRGNGLLTASLRRLGSTALPLTD